MKLKFGFFLALMIAGVVVAHAQGGFRRTVKERVHLSWIPKNKPKQIPFLQTITGSRIRLEKK